MTTTKPSKKLKRLIAAERERLLHRELRPCNTFVTGDCRAFSDERIAQIAARIKIASNESGVVHPDIRLADWGLALPADGNVGIAMKTTDQPLILLDPKADNTDFLAGAYALPKPKRSFTWVSLSEAKPKAKRRARAV